MTNRPRLSATVAAEPLAAGRAALVVGREGESLSAWVNDALQRQADHDRRMRALDDFLDAYETEHGEDHRGRDARRDPPDARAVVVRTPPQGRTPPPLRDKLVA
jgi:alkanesulfonate monooxygenase SsuD/methylene tetrahydromethanopterin reductase-like flavin-dependent oxidoreductase (luciferase family)